MHSLRLPLLAALILLTGGLPARAQKAKPQIVIFKDGFVVYGRVTRPTQLLHDSKTGSSLPIAVPGGFYRVDDEVRMVIFAPSQVHNTLDDETGKNRKAISLGAGFTPPGRSDPLPSSWTVVDTGPFNDKLVRTLQMETSAGDFPIMQRIAKLTPKAVHLQALKYLWLPSYYTREFGPDAVLDFIRKDLKFNRSGHPKTPFERQELIYRFLLQAGWTDHAEKALEDMLRQFPAQRKKLEEYRDKFHDLVVAPQFVEGIEQASKAGQHKEAQERLARFYELKMHRITAPEFQKFQLKAQAVKLRYTAANEKLKDVRRFLEGLKFGTLPPLHLETYKDMIKTILEELNYDTLPQLETFLGQARDHERARKGNRPPSCTPEQLLGFAVSGWLLGDGAAERDPALARRLWLARKLVLESQNDQDMIGRKQRAASFERDKTVGVDVVARLIPRLPPPEPYDKLDTNPIQLTAGAGGLGASYHVQLPPEYHHYRAYPVLMVLHHSGEKAADELARWADLAARHGYILAAPEWAGQGGKAGNGDRAKATVRPGQGVPANPYGKGVPAGPYGKGTPGTQPGRGGLKVPAAGGGQAGKVEYQYTPREHAAVLGCLRDLRRRFQIDSDRVFLFGCEEGGKMAYDVGLSHPDQFAGVMPMSATPRYFPFRYASNAQNLPFYVVNGEMTGVKAKDNRALFRDWIRWNYPSLLVEYKGRASDYFTAELETMFDWMKNKKRLTPQRVLGGKDAEFKTMRATDNRFYWLSTAHVDVNRQNSKQFWNQNLMPATMWAAISSGNQIHVRTHGLGQVTVWLGPGMLNYTEKVHLRLNSATVFAARLIQPSLEVLLEDFFQMGDRQRLFWARLDLKT